MMFDIPIRRQSLPDDHNKHPQDFVKPSNVNDPVDPTESIHEVSAEQLQEFILEALAFKSMTERQEEVAEAHQKTFGWILDESPADDVRREEGLPGNVFLHWLRDKNIDSSGIYWIGGKAGSGKSTLLRFIYDNEQTDRELQDWAGSKPITKAGFFFWTSGSFEQRSQGGLLRSLLYQLLEQHREYASVTFPSIWEIYKRMTTKQRVNAPIEWTLFDLMQGLKLFLQHAVEKTNICLFIDGLDEFEGNHAKIIDLFSTLVEAGKGSIKACLSSRPWPVFENAFGSVPHLKLQSLTMKDRRRYVVDKFKQDSAMNEVVSNEFEDGSKLMEEIVQRADGVFLWVILVVRTLLGELKLGDRVSDIKQRLELLPSDLEAFFQHMLFRSQKRDVTIVASRIFQLIRSREIICDFTGDHDYSSLTLWEIALASSEDDDLVLKGPIEQPSKKEVTRLCTKTTNQIESSCAGLLEFHMKDVGSELESLTQTKITYLHRTIRDWLIYSPGVWDSILEYTSISTYDPHSSHLRSYILQLKLPLGRPKQHRRYLEWWPGIVLSLSHARFVPKNIAITNALIDELNLTLCDYWLEKPSVQDDHWARSTFGSYEDREKRKAVISHPFLSLATKFGLSHYISDKVSNNEMGIDYHGGYPLLSYAIDFLISRRQTVFPLSSPEFVVKLLENGQDPNLKYLDFKRLSETPWLHCLKLVREALRRNWIDVRNKEDLQRWTKIVHLFLEHGADPNAVIVADVFDPEINAMDVIDSVLAKFDVPEIRGIKDIMITKAGEK